jgi:hypothetical protein
MQPLKARVIENIEAPPERRFQVQYSHQGYSWWDEQAYPDQLSAEIRMEQLLAPPRIVSQAERGKRP